MLIDTHAHLFFDDYANDLEQVLARAKEAGVEKIIVPSVDLATSLKSIELAKKYPGTIYGAVGIHPEETTEKDWSPREWEDELSKLDQMILDNREWIVAVGEIGTDANTDELKKSLPLQMKLMKKQCELAIRFDLPVIVHTRNSFAGTWEVLKSLSMMPRGQFHCFSVDEEALKLVVGAGFYVSFCGNITWSKRVGKLAAMLPIERLLLETDSPLMVPRDMKGNPVNGLERNESANMRYLLDKLVSLRTESPKEIADKSSYNAMQLFHL
jgi:TatD DNase family protein